MASFFLYFLRRAIQEHFQAVHFLSLKHLPLLDIPLRSDGMNRCLHPIVFLPGVPQGSVTEPLLFKHTNASLGPVTYSTQLIYDPTVPVFLSK